MKLLDPWSDKAITARFCAFRDDRAQRRNNRLFADSRAGGQWATVLMSLAQSHKHNQVEPCAYLKDVCERLPTLGEPTPTIS